MWERAKSVVMCQTVLIVASLGEDEFAGFSAGYIGEGEFASEPFHVRFCGEQPVHLIVGERSPLTRREVLFEQWPQAARLGVMAARQQLRSLIKSDDEGILIASAAELPRIKWIKPDEGVSSLEKIDPRVWLRIPAQLGLASPAEDDAS